MKLESVKLVYFSPTGTTRAVVQGIARGLEPVRVELVDITRPEARAEPLRMSQGELLVVAAPVYMGRVPALLEDWLNALEARNTPAVCVVVYGNRAFDNALLELRDVLKSRGCAPVAGAAFIGEHSFSEPGTPTAHGRPDAADLSRAEDFGRKIRQKLESMAEGAAFPELEVPGQYPYGGVTKLWDVDFIEVSHLCTQCGFCVGICPVGAIDSGNSALVDEVKCITCCACIKNCPQHARAMKPGPVMEARKRLHNLYSGRKEPECFL